MTAVSMPSALPSVAVRRGHFAMWRAVAATPAVVGSGMVLLVLFGWLGRWEGLVLLGWLGCGAAVFTRSGERIAVRVGCGFRRPTAAQAALIEPVWAAALHRVGARREDVDLYMQNVGAPNAYAAGGRSVAVTAGVLREFLARRLGPAEMEAVLVHELGHHATRATRLALLTTWLALPWRVASRFVLGVAFALAGRRQPPPLLAMVTVIALVVAVAQLGRQGQAVSAMVLAGVAVCAVACPLGDAWVSRRSEYAADRFTAERGAGPQLMAALRRLDRSVATGRSGWARRTLSGHPSVERRCAELQRCAVRFCLLPGCSSTVAS
jgi:STE24 endopeptidase